MLTRRIHVPMVVVGLLTLASLGNAAEDKNAHEPMHTMEHHQLPMDILHRVETAQTPADHEAIAKAFDDEAKQFEEQAAQHAHLAKRYEKGLGVGPKSSGASLAQHCGNLSKNLQESAKEAREMAQMHRQMAKEAH